VYKLPVVVIVVVVVVVVVGGVAVNNDVKLLLLLLLLLLHEVDGFGFGDDVGGAGLVANNDVKVLPLLMPDDGSDGSEPVDEGDGAANSDDPTKLSVLDES
jgi:hypothetical protein